MNGDIGEPLKGQVTPFGSMVEYHFISAEDQSLLHQFGKKVLPGKFLGFALFAGENLERETLWSRSSPIPDPNSCSFYCVIGRGVSSPHRKPGKGAPCFVGSRVPSREGNLERVPHVSLDQGFLVEREPGKGAPCFVGSRVPCREGTWKGCPMFRWIKGSLSRGNLERVPHVSLAQGFLVEREPGKGAPCFVGSRVPCREGAWKGCPMFRWIKGSLSRGSLQRVPHVSLDQGFLVEREPGKGAPCFVGSRVPCREGTWKGCPMFRWIKGSLSRGSLERVPHVSLDQGFLVEREPGKGAPCFVGSRVPCREGTWKGCPMFRWIKGSLSRGNLERVPHFSLDQGFLVEREPGKGAPCFVGSRVPCREGTWKGCPMFRWIKGSLSRGNLERVPHVSLDQGFLVEREPGKGAPCFVGSRVPCREGTWKGCPMFRWIKGSLSRGNLERVPHVSLDQGFLVEREPGKGAPCFVGSRVPCREGTWKGCPMFRWIKGSLSRGNLERVPHVSLDQGFLVEREPGKGAPCFVGSRVPCREGTWKGCPMFRWIKGSLSRGNLERVPHVSLDQGFLVEREPGKGAPCFVGSRVPCREGTWKGCPMFRWIKGSLSRGNLERVPHVSLDQGFLVEREPGKGAPCFVGSRVPCREGTWKGCPMFRWIKGSLSRGNLERVPHVSLDQGFLVEREPGKGAPCFVGSRVPCREGTWKGCPMFRWIKGSLSRGNLERVPHVSLDQGFLVEREPGKGAPCFVGSRVPCREGTWKGCPMFRWIKGSLSRGNLERVPHVSLDQGFLVEREPGKGAPCFVGSRVPCREGTWKGCPMFRWIKGSLSRGNLERVPHVSLDQGFLVEREPGKGAPCFVGSRVPCREGTMDKALDCVTVFVTVFTFRRCPNIFFFFTRIVSHPHALSPAHDLSTTSRTISR